jgi:hypothetical protein
MINVLQQEAATGFRRLAGTQLRGTVPLTQALLNGVLRQIRQVPSGLQLEIQAANRIVVRYGVVQASGVLHEVVRVGQHAPQITVELASSIIAWTLKQTLKMAAVRIDGRRVTIDLGALEGMAAYRQYWPYLQSIRVRTTPGRLQVDFEVTVN